MRKHIVCLAAAAVALLGAVSCFKTTGGDEEQRSVYFKSFGFFKEDNPGLPKDYVVSEGLETVTEIVIEIPADADMTVFSELAPRFELCAPDVIAKVGNDILISADQIAPDEAPAARGSATAAKSISVLDLRNPVEIVVTDGKNSKSYIIYISVSHNE